MKPTGIVRKVDELGRVVIPKELRTVFDIDTGAALEIFTDGDNVVLRKYQASMTCAVTGEVSDQNIRVADGALVLSEEGARQILEELKSLEKPEYPYGKLEVARRRRR